MEKSASSSGSHGPSCVQRLSSDSYSPLMSADPSTRTPIDPNQIGPVSVFDSHLRGIVFVLLCDYCLIYCALVLSESYIAFFQER